MVNIQIDLLISIRRISNLKLIGKVDFLLQLNVSSVTKSQGKTATVEVLQDPITIPPPSNVEKAVNPKIDRIAQEITALNLIEVAELSDVLKKRLNLPDAPVMPIGGVAIANKPEVMVSYYCLIVSTGFNFILKF